ncbi:hypothetical protein SOVF_210810 [Spinacia oleracea]|uniref:Homeobox-leucine zipper protein HAT22 n=1 Tax=Spinacia oleracea TaxID=3562 RepID=A0A9R0IZN3_SPIOL|nr:homeobox-leucine zipper protein HAT22 [Spinacia oleracea]KNA03269.1 hypothetical protein SOVF_210810 [Spinacia oleracea]
MDSHSHSKYQIQDQALTLGLGISSSSSLLSSKTKQVQVSIPSAATSSCYHHHEPSLTLSLSGDTYTTDTPIATPVKVVEPPCSGGGGVSVVSVKRERESACSSDDLEIERGGGSSRISDEDEDGSAGPTNTPRKKLRLTLDQSALLEESFKQQSTLNPKQKLALADRLNLRPRQVEVWFQNRRARTKLKQTEVDCEHLRKCFETLTDENRRLQKELQELKALKLGQPFYMHLPTAAAAALTMCPSCERIGASVPTIQGTPTTTSTSTTTNASNKGTPFTLGLSKSHFYPSPHQIPSFTC